MSDPDSHHPVFGLFGNIAKVEALEALLRAVEFLEARGVPYLLETGALHYVQAALDRRPRGLAFSRDEVARRADVVIVFGGDGTMLAAAQSTLRHGTPLLGVNLGKLGFLADVTTDGMTEAFERILRHENTVEERMTLAGVLHPEERVFHALNDIVISKSGAAKVISVDVWVNDGFLASFLADGIIVSTPTGSTAYSLATGGPVVTPSSDVLIISPISAHTLTARPVIVSGNSAVRIAARAEEGAITVMADGHTIVENRRVAEIRIARGERTVRLVKNPGQDYFEMLRAKLAWAHDGRFHRPGAARSDASTHR